MGEYSNVYGTFNDMAAAAKKKQSPTPEPEPEVPRPEERTQTVPDKSVVYHETKTPSNLDTLIPRHQETKVEETNDDYTEIIRKAVKQLGKEAATYRFTADEKRALADIVYELRKKGFRSSENELTRIAINFLVAEHRHNKQASILSRVLERLNA